VTNPIYSTASTILTQVRDETGVGSNPSSSALQNTALLRQLDDINHEFVNYPYTIGMLGWKFLEREVIVETKANTALNGAISSGAASITVDSTAAWTDPAGAAIEAGYIATGNDIFDFFTFEDMTATTMTSVDNIQIDHTDDSAVHKIYKLPANYGKVRNVIRQSNSQEYFYTDPTITQLPRANQYTVKILTSGTNSYSASFLVFREDIGALEFKVYYMIQPTTISATGTSVDAPNGPARRFIVEAMKEYTWSVMGEQDEANLARQRAQRALQSAIDEWVVPTIQPNQNLEFSEFNDFVAL